MPTYVPDTVDCAAAVRPRLVLFDIDRTLLSTEGGSLRAMTTAARMVFGDAFTFDGVNRTGNLDPLIIAEAVRLNGCAACEDAIGEFARLYINCLRDELHTTRRLPGAIEVVREVNAMRHVKLGLVTGNYPAAADLKLRHVGIEPDWFDCNGFGTDGTDRASIVAHAAHAFEQKTGVKPSGQDVMVIGDTPRDMMSGRAHGYFTVGVTTGPYDEAELLEAGADAVLPDLTKSALILEAVRP